MNFDEVKVVEYVRYLSKKLLYLKPLSKSCKNFDAELKNIL